MAVVVTGLGVLSALGRVCLTERSGEVARPERSRRREWKSGGASLGDQPHLPGHWTSGTWEGLLEGRSAIALRQPFAELPPRPLAMLGKQSSSLDALLLEAVTEALQDAGLSLPLADCGVVIGSSRGYQGQWESFLARGEIEHWLDSLPHMGAIAVTHKIGSGGPVLAPMAACATGLWAIAQGVELLRTGQCERVLVGAAETPITPLALTGFEQMRALARSGCYPFDEQREGLALGEGVAVLVLETEQAAKTRLAPVYGRVLGAGLTADANHVTAPDAANYQGGLAAIKTCLQRSGLQPEDIDFIHAHGTGTWLNDAYETALIQALFPPEVWVMATKGATGHTLGASGAIGAAVCLLALRDQILPTCVGLSQPAFDLNLVRQTQTAVLSNALCFSFGFGGQNAVVAFSKAL
ncbi:MAG: beta-ketoacyl-ACP synthase [Leptolyngbyaceae cyanobacterium]